MNSVSVIIPLYNKRPFFKACLEALCEQTVAPSEIIVIDDGSTDGSRALAHEQAARFVNTSIAYRVIEQDHRGVSAALNSGLDEATSVFVTRVDADDLVAPRWIEIMLAQDIAHKPVSIRCTHQRVSRNATQSTLAFFPADQNAPKLQPMFSDIASGSALYERLFRDADTNLMSTCGMFYVREELNRLSLRFDERLTNTEDVLFNATLFAHNKPAILVEAPLYFYRQVPQSLSKSVPSLFVAADALKKALEELAEQGTTARVAHAHRLDTLHYLCVFYSIALLDEEKNRTHTPSYRERIISARANSSIDEIFRRARLEGVMTPLASWLATLLASEQYAQLQLSARALNIARAARRSIKIYHS